MAINPAAVGTTTEPVVSSWTSTDSLLYALGVGCGTSDLALTTENSLNVEQRMLPTQVVTLADMSGVFAHIGSFNPAMVVHGEQRIRLLEEVPPSGRVSTVAEITAIYDKGKGAVVEVTGRSSDVDTGRPLFESTMSVFIRGEGGWGGERGPSVGDAGIPDSVPDASVTYHTSPDQALLYRLSGDRNPLHSDPSFAQLAGFDRPILHGLCTFGFSGRALLGELCDGDPERFESMQGRFSAPVFPGEDLTVQIWRTEPGTAQFRTLGHDGRVVIDHGATTFH